MSAVFLFLLALAVTCYQVSTGASSQWAVHITGGEDEARSVAQRHGFVFGGQIGELENVYKFSAGKGRSLLSNIRSLRGEQKVGFMERQQVRFYEKKGFQEPTDPLWNKQWALHRSTKTEVSAVYDLNVVPAWLQGMTGEGVTVGIVDDGLQHTHPDLSGNYDDNSSYDFVGRDHDPSPYTSFGYSEAHGTKCAGIVGMSKSNGVCGVGVAYNAKIAGLRLIANQGVTDSQEAEALNYHFQDIDIYSNSWGPNDNGFTVEGPRLLAKLALENGAMKGRGNKGSIFVWASGNGGSSRLGDSCASDGYVNSIYTIAIGSVDSNGAASYYDEKCSAKMAVTFSFNAISRGYTDDTTHIATTTVGSKCTNTFTGTSAATPLASGVIALTLQANPSLTWRDVQYLVVYTSNSQVLMKGDNSNQWMTNGAGLNVSSQFGFGAIDAEAMVTRAKTWTNVPKQIEKKITPPITTGYVSSGSSAFNIDWTVTNNTSEHDAITNPTNITFLEHVIVKLSLKIISQAEESFDYSDYYNTLYNQPQNLDDLIYHSQARRGDIKVTLTSPHGTESTLLPYRDRDFIDSKGYDQWSFMSVQFWGEDPNGHWTCSVSYRGTSGSVNVSDVEVKLYGVQSAPESVRNIPKTCPSTCRNNRCSAAAQCDVCESFRDLQTMECAPNCASGADEISKYCINPKLSSVYSSLISTVAMISSSISDDDHLLISPTTTTERHLISSSSSLVHSEAVASTSIASIVTTTSTSSTSSRHRIQTVHLMSPSPTLVVLDKPKLDQLGALSGSALVQSSLALIIILSFSVALTVTLL